MKIFTNHVMFTGALFFFTMSPLSPGKNPISWLSTFAWSILDDLWNDDYLAWSRENASERAEMEIDTKQKYLFIFIFSWIISTVSRAMLLLIRGKNELF